MAAAIGYVRGCEVSLRAGTCSVSRSGESAFYCVCVASDESENCITYVDICVSCPCVCVSCPCVCVCVDAASQRGGVA